MGVGVALYYFLTYDFITSPRKLEFVNLFGKWLMGIRPETGWTSIHPNYVAGIVAVCVPFILYPVLEYRRSKNRYPFLFVVLVVAGSLLAGAALIMTTSRGVVFAIFSGLGIWFLWKLTNLVAAGHVRKIFSFVLLAYLIAVVAFLYAGPAQAAGAVTGPSPYGNGSRAELFLTAIYLTQDFPLTGGGLASFPGLFSQYMLNIPFYYLPNSHNLFLDVAIEQGLIGGAIFLGLYLASVWKVSSSIAMGRGLSEFQWILLFSLVVAMVHGMVDNYLYNGAGSLLSLFLIGLSVNKVIQPGDVQAGYVVIPLSPAISSAIVFVAMVAGLILLRSTWYANLGAVRLAKIELAGFPANAWAESSVLAELGPAEAPLQSALRVDPANRTAHHRLGLIAMSRGDFESAAAHFVAANQQSPNHRGIAKALGYSYAWLGEADHARLYLERIPETRSELEAYAWWWQTQGRQDLSAKASRLAASMKNETSKP
jgi:tetratricopeptide (TPR) repeat protein